MAFPVQRHCTVRTRETDLYQQPRFRRDAVVFDTMAERKPPASGRLSIYQSEPSPEDRPLHVFDKAPFPLRHSDIPRNNKHGTGMDACRPRFALPATQVQAILSLLFKHLC
jgi:hypothetical protein